MSSSAEAFAWAWQYHQARNFPQAEQLYRQILQIDPSYADAWCCLGMLLAQHDKLAEATACFERGVGCAPEHVDLLNNLGLALSKQGRTAEAIPYYQTGLRLRPDHAEAHNNLGIALKEQGKYEEAVASYRQALSLRPDFIDARNNLGNALKEQGKHEEAIACYRHALTLNPNYAEAHNGLGIVLNVEGKFDEALAHYEQTLQLAPNHAEAHLHRAVLWLLQGDFARGWPEYEWRWQTRYSMERFFPRPRWDGSPLQGQVILLHAEQGLGDTLQFIRYAPLVQQRGGRVLAECQPALTTLVASCPGVEHVVPYGSLLPDFAVQAPLLSLPAIFRTSLASIPADVPYLFADSALVERWGKELAAVPAFKVGIVWQGNFGNKGDRFRSVPLAQFAPLAEVEGVRLFSLQVGRGSEQMSALGNRFEVVDLGGRFNPASLSDAAAVIRNLDLVVSVDTAVAHLAGALGVPVWLTLPLVPDCRWLLERDDSPWYPGMSLFRQGPDGQWPKVFERMAGAVKKCVATRSSSCSAPITI